MSLEFPNEVWLHIFSLVSDRPSLKAIILSSRRFHDLALAELLRSVSWNSAEKAEAHLDFFETRVDCRKVPTRLAFTLQIDGDTQSESVTTIVGRISWFANLRTLSFTNASLDGLFYTTLSQLPRLTDLTLDSCSLASPPLVIPPTPLQISSPLAVNLDIPVTHLAVSSLSTLYPVNVHTLYRHLFGLLRNVVSLTLRDQFPLLVDLLPALHSLSIYASSDEDAVSLLNDRYLPLIGSRLLHLRVNFHLAPLDFRTPVQPVQLVELSAPFLQSFTGSLYLAYCLVPTSPNLSSITISTVVKKTQDALALIEAVSAAPIEEIELGVEDWDDEILLGITHRLPSCRQIKVLFYYSQPSEDFLFNLGLQHLPCLPHLHTLHVHAVPIPPPPPMHAFHRRHNFPSTEETPPRIPAVDPEEEKSEEYLAVWKKYNPKLRAVKFVKGREWRREGEGGRWFVWSLQDVAEHQGDGAEEEIEDSEWFEDEDEGGSLGWESGVDG
ncbi:hypothetical protein R3P38DRAFT_3218976 [Favolaschia claudopus]|uniref:F-box domain-containing protein n=1 Tax=Favolaschia claudopus TaxID=2862362 RepID=A0AAW0A3M9_9AGAR